MRSIQYTYRDPLDVIWTTTADRLGMKVQRSAEVYAAWDGRGTLTIGTPETLDPDDCLAQMVFHEICHALVQGPEARELPDWGLHHAGRQHRVDEYACLRLQAQLAGPFGLRQFLAPTTEFRSYYDALPPDPLTDEIDPAVAKARSGRQRASLPPWSAPLIAALQATARLFEQTGPFADATSLWHASSPPARQAPKQPAVAEGASGGARAE